MTFAIKFVEVTRLRYLLIVVVTGPYCMCNMVYILQTTSRYRLLLYLSFLQLAYYQAGRLYLYHFEHILKGTGKKISSSFFDYGASYRVILNQDVSVVIKNLV